MNNDPPQVFGEDTRDYPVYPGPVRYQDDGDFPAFRGWGERVEPVAPDDAYPYQPGPGPTDYPQGPGYALDQGYAPDLGYPHEPAASASYLPDHGYVVDHGYATEPGFAEDRGYAGD